MLYIHRQDYSPLPQIVESEWGKGEYSELGLRPFNSINGIED